MWLKAIQVVILYNFLSVISPQAGGVQKKRKQFRQKWFQQMESLKYLRNPVKSMTRYKLGEIKYSPKGKWHQYYFAYWQKEEIRHK